MITAHHLIYRIDPSLRLRRAIHAADTSLARRIILSHPGLLQNPDTSPSGLSNTSLHLASHLGHADIVSALLTLGHERHGVSLNEDHQTALMLAAAAGHTEVVHLICTSEASAREAALSAESAAQNMTDAYPGGQIDLVTSSSSIGRRDVRGRDAVMEACRGGHDTCLQILLTFAPGGDPARLLANADIDGNTALHFASSNGHLLVLRTLLAAGADSERRNVWSWTPIAYSATVQAEVYFKGLVAEVEKRKAKKREVMERGTGAGLRMVDD